MTHSMTYLRPGRMTDSIPGRMTGSIPGRMTGSRPGRMTGSTIPRDDNSKISFKNNPYKLENIQVSIMNFNNSYSPKKYDSLKKGMITERTVVSTIPCLSCNTPFLYPNDSIKCKPFADSWCKICAKVFEIKRAEKRGDIDTFVMNALILSLPLDSKKFLLNNGKLLVVSNENTYVQQFEYETVFKYFQEYPLIKPYNNKIEINLQLLDNLVSGTRLCYHITDNSEINKINKMFKKHFLIKKRKLNLLRKIAEKKKIINAIKLRIVKMKLHSAMEKETRSVRS